MTLVLSIIFSILYVSFMSGKKKENKTPNQKPYQSFPADWLTYFISTKERNCNFSFDSFVSLLDVFPLIMPGIWILLKNTSSSFTLCKRTLNNSLLISWQCVNSPAWCGRLSSAYATTAALPLCSSSLSRFN